MEEKLFELMAQAEDLQKHAAKLQKEAQDAFSALPLAVEQAGQKIRATGLLGALIVLACGIVVAAVAVVGVWWSTSSLRDEATELRNTIAILKQHVAKEEKTLQLLMGKTWKLELVNWDDARGIILPKGVQFVRQGQMKDGRDAVVIKP